VGSFYIIAIVLIFEFDGFAPKSYMDFDGFKPIADICLPLMAGREEKNWMYLFMFLLSVIVIFSLQHSRTTVPPSGSETSE